MITIQIKVNKNRLSIARPEYLTSGCVNTVACSFVFGDEWNGYEKVAVFESGDDMCEHDSVKQSIVDNSCMIPPSILKSPKKIRVGVVGVKGDKTIVTGKVRMSVDVGADKNGTDEPEYQLTLLEQLLQAVLEAKTLSQSVYDDAEAGKFDGYTPQRGVDYWTEEDITEIKAYIDQNSVVNGNDKHYSHTQNIASAVWEITHNLGKHPSVSVVDSANSAVIGEVRYINENQLTVSFSGAFSGKAFLN